MGGGVWKAEEKECLESKDGRWDCQHDVARWGRKVLRAGEREGLFHFKGTSFAPSKSSTQHGTLLCPCHLAPWR